MHVRHLTLADFRSYASLELGFSPGPTALVGPNGEGKTNVVEAVDYLSRLGSHRVAQEAPLVRAGAERAVVRAAVVKDGREAVLEVEITPGSSNRARVNRAPLERPRDLLGLVRTVTFAPDDLMLVKGDPAERRRFLDDLAVLRTPRLAGTRAEYDRVLKQRNTLLKSLRPASGRAGRREERPPAHGGLDDTLDVWDTQLAASGAELLAARLGLVEELQGHLGDAYAAVARGASREDAHAAYQSSVPLDDVVPGDRDGLQQAFSAALRARREEETDRGVSLVGPHRDDLRLSLGQAGALLPVRGYASHGEQWSCALALRLASYRLLRADGDDPILILDDVFAELDAGRREQLAALVADTEQVLVTAAVADDVPAVLRQVQYVVADGEVRT